MPLRVLGLETVHERYEFLICFQRPVNREEPPAESCAREILDYTRDRSVLRVSQTELDGDGA